MDSRITKTPAAGLLVAFVLVLVSSASPSPVGALTPSGGYDPDGAWPLCGSYFKEAGGSTATSCPVSRMGDPTFRDRTNDTFGPRLRGGTYDWHRGIDLDTEGILGRPVFAYTCGEVVSVNGSLPNHAVVIRHFRSYDCTGAHPTSCGSDGCYYSRYQHLESAGVAVDDWVERGEKIGTSGLNCTYDGTTHADGTLDCIKPGGSLCVCDPSTGQCTGSGCYEHVHFEVRDSYGSAGLGWSQRRAIHPLSALPYDNSSGAGDITVTFGTVQLADPLVVGIDVSMANTDASGTGASDIDLERVEVEVYENQGTTLVRIDQPNLGAAYPTPEGDAYQVFPPFLDFAERGRQYNYESSTNLPFSDFQNNGAFESPFADTSAPAEVFDPDFPTSYDADYHLEATGASSTVGEFNAIEIGPEDFDFSDTQYALHLTFKHLEGPTNLGDLCLKAFAVDARGATTAKTEWGDCDTTPPPPPPPAPPAWVDVQWALCYGVNDIDWPAVSGATSYRVYSSPYSDFHSGVKLEAKPTSSRYVLLVPVGGGPLYLRVHACGSGGCSGGTMGDDPAIYKPLCL